MTKQLDSIAELFAKGCFREISEHSENRQDTSDLEYIVGSLCLLGRVDEAALYFARYSDSISKTQTIACRFFLGMGLTRLSKRKEGEGYLIANLLELRGHPSDLQKFYIYQGLAFYRNLGCRYSHCLRAAEQAWKAAVSANFLWGRILAADMKGHCLIQTGEMTLGIASLKDANRIAKKIGNEGFVAATESTIACIEATMGTSATDAVDNLVKSLEVLSPEDNYSRIGLLIDLSRELSLRGRLRESDYYLSEAGQLIYTNQHRRYEGFLNFRMAYNSRLRGEFEESLSYIDKVMETLDPRLHLDLKIQALGLRVSIIEKQGKDPDTALVQELDHLVRFSGSGRGKREMARSGRLSWRPKRADDPIGDLVDLIRSSETSLWVKLEEVIKRGLLSFLPEILGIEPGQRRIVLDPIPGALLIVDQGNLRISTKGLTPAMRSCLKALNDNHTGKDQLIEQVWGYRYDPLRHDPLIYGLMGRIRTTLDEYSGWISASDGGYSLEPGIGVIFLNPNANTQEKAARSPSKLTIVGEEEDSPFEQYEDFDLNLRQLKFISSTKVQDLYTTSDYQRMFPDISRITASRDLSMLVKYRLLKRTGKARATSYYRTSGLN